MLGRKKFKKDCYENIKDTMVYIIQETSNKMIEASVLRFLKHLVDNMCAEIHKDMRSSISPKDKYEFINSLSYVIDKCLKEDMTPEIFNVLMDFVAESQDNAMKNKKKKEKFVSFVNIITKRIPTCTNKDFIVDTIITKIADPGFHSLFFDHDNFPQWLVTFFSASAEHVENLGFVFFEKSAGKKNFKKLKS